jgi:histidinol phosphatase-like enzyme
MAEVVSAGWQGSASRKDHSGAYGRNEAVTRAVFLDGDGVINQKAPGGDSDSDIQAGKNAGCRTARLSGKKQTENDAADDRPAGDADIVASFLDAIQHILPLGHS